MPTDPLLRAARTTYRGSVATMVQFVLVILAAVRTMVGFILVMVAAPPLLHLLWR